MSERSERLLAGYGVALVLAATVLLAAGSRGTAWSLYGLLCEVIGIGAVVRAGRIPRPLLELPRLLNRVSGSVTRVRAAVASRSGASANRLGPTQVRAIRAECTKFLSLRSNGIAPALTMVCIVGSAFSIAATTKAPPEGWGYLGFNPGIDLLLGVWIATLAVGVLGVLVITADYATGLIRSALIALPTRRPVLLAKLAVVVSAGAAIAVVAVSAAVFIGVAELRSRGWTIALTDPRPWTTAGWAALYLVLVGVIGLSLGALLRSTAAAISAVVAIFYLVPILVHLLPAAAMRWCSPYLPSTAGSAMWGHPIEWHLGSRPAALAVFAAWAAVLFTAGSLRVLRDDA